MSGGQSAYSLSLSVQTPPGGWGWGWGVRPSAVFCVPSTLTSSFQAGHLRRWWLVWGGTSGCGICTCEGLVVGWVGSSAAPGMSCPLLGRMSSAVRSPALLWGLQKPASTAPHTPAWPSTACLPGVPGQWCRHHGSTCWKSPTAYFHPQGGTAHHGP